MPFFAPTVNMIGPFEFLLDTGGSGGHVDGEIAKRLGLKLERGIASVSGFANLEVGIIPEATLAVGAVRHRGQLLVCCWRQSSRFWGARSKASSAATFCSATCWS